jgi:transcriptional regulator with XRE-family HTH domain
MCNHCTRRVKPHCAFIAIESFLGCVHTLHMPKPTIGNLRGRQMRRTFLKEWRIKRGHSQEEAADLIGIDRSMLSKIESGKMAYSQQFLEAAAEAYMCEPADLLIRNPTDPDGIWSVWDSAKDGQKRQIVEIAKTIIKTGTDN